MRNRTHGSPFSRRQFIGQLAALVGAGAPGAWPRDEAMAADRSLPMPSTVANARSKLLAGAWPFTLPASGQRGFIGSNHLVDCATTDKNSTDLRGILAGFGSAAVINIKDTAGTVVDWLYMIFGGGHSDGYGDGVYCFRGSTGVFEELLPSVTTAPRNSLSDFDLTYGEIRYARPASVHIYEAAHGIDSDEPNGPAYMLLFALGFSYSGGAGVAQAHLFDVRAKQWKRWGSGPLGSINTNVHTVLKDSRRKKFFVMPATSMTRICSLDYATTAKVDWIDTNDSGHTALGDRGSAYQCGTYDPVGDLYLWGPNAYLSGSDNVWYTDPNNLVAGPTQLTTTGARPKTCGCGMEYSASRDQFLLIDTFNTNPPTTLYVLTPPSTGRKTGTWTWSARTFTGPASKYYGLNTSYNRWRYVSAIDSLVCCPDSLNRLEVWKI